MANQIQATVYQIDGNPLTTPISVSFLTSDIMMYETTLSNIPDVQSAIVYYPSTSNQLQTQTFFVSEDLATLLTNANSGSASQITSPILEINDNPLVSPINYSFPANGVSIWSKTIGISTVTYVSFKNKTYTTGYDEATLIAQANAGGGGGGSQNLQQVCDIGNTYIGTLITITDGATTSVQYAFNGIYMSTNFGGDVNLLQMNVNEIKFVDNGLNQFKIEPTGSINYFDNTSGNVTYFNVNNNLINTYTFAVNSGLNLDFTHSLFQFGDYGNDINGYYINVDNDINEIKTFANNLEYGLYVTLGLSKLGDTSGSVNGTLLNIDDNNNLIYTAGQNGNFGLQIENISGGTTKTTIGDFSGNLNGTYLEVNDNLKQIITYLNNTNYGLFIGDTTSGCYLGDYYENYNGGWFGVFDASSTLVVSGSLSTGIPGISSNQRIKVQIGGVNYLIVLEEAP